MARGALICAGAAFVLALGRTSDVGAMSARAPGGCSLEVVYDSSAALRVALRDQPVRLVRVLPALHVAEVRAETVPAGLMRRLLQAKGIRAVRATVERASAVASPAFAVAPTTDTATSGWQYHAAGLDRVPQTVLSAARRFKIAIVDTGVDVHAPALAGKIAGSYDVRTGTRNVTDPTGHGTFVTSLAAGFGGAARVLVVKALGTSRFTDLDVAAGILYAVDHGARVINLSIAGRARSPIEASAVRYASRRGALIVAAAGNDALAGNPPEYPAALLQPLGSNGLGGLGLVVGASDALGVRAPFSEWGSFVSLAAPGVSVLGMLSSSAKLGLYGVASGTSFAAPEVAGAAALVWAADPRLSAGQVAEILKQTASGAGNWTPNLGFGVIDVGAAVDRALSDQA